MVAEVSHPRSEWMRLALAARRRRQPAEARAEIAEDFALLARSGDISHGEAEEGVYHSHPDLARSCKVALEVDRSLRMQEQGYETRMLKIVGRSDLYAKTDLLVGWPRSD